ncbi:GNAT family N-acetyltransferase [Azospirillum sp. SYSU D00513]|uniref:GNAT family N-acetyltransferase n=1 Tax=Azospirillum sp. SYSU D00513 TaxID=2812561 RepID=UPI001A97863B|nr:GNAT family N-acetyltransferase [Azospirillum sp. SYSU D00513]
MDHRMFTGTDHLPSGIPSFDIDLRPLDAARDLEPVWRSLEDRADPSFFLSWHWIGSWLECLPDGVRPHLLTARHDGEMVGLAVLCPRTVRRFGLLPARRWFLHETGDALFDRIFMEYNGLLVDRRWAAAVTEACLFWLHRSLPRRDELVLSGLDALTDGAARHVAERLGGRLELRTGDLCRYVDLEPVRRAGGDYRASLGRNTRAAVRRTERLYAGRGPLAFRVAGTVEEALADFERLETLHQAHWTARGKPGAFANPAFRPFHRTLIRRGVPAGAVRLCRVGAGGETIGILYNFAYRGQVLNYQGGFAYEPDNRLKPGVLSHVLAIEDSLERGERCYDFMSTPSGHKPLLANAQRPMNWLVFGPYGVAHRFEAGLRRAGTGTARRCRQALHDLVQRQKDAVTAR